MLSLFTVPIIMGCALAGTVGMLKVIRKVSPERFDSTGSAEKKEEKKK